MTINLILYKDNKVSDELLTSGDRIYITLNSDSTIEVKEHKEITEKELAKIRRERNMYVFENTSRLLLINGENIEIAQIESNDIITYTDFAIVVKIYNFNIKIAYLEEEKSGKRYRISRFLTFIGEAKFSHIPAEEKNPLIPLSPYSAAIVIRDGSYYLIPINSSVVKFRMKDLKIPINLENNTKFEVGSSVFTFKES